MTTVLPTVERVEVAPGFSVSRVLTGLWQVADLERAGGLDLEAAATAMERYRQSGLTTFDLADHYGSAEVIAGKFHTRHSGGPAELLTKWVPSPGPVSASAVRVAIERSLTRMQTDSLDVLQFHTWSYSDHGYLEQLEALEKLQNEGLIRHLALTNFDTEHLRAVVEAGIKVVTNQVCFSLLDQRPLRAMAPFCRDHAIKLLAYGTLAGGFLTERSIGAHEPSTSELTTSSQKKYKRFLDLAGSWQDLQSVLSAMKRIAEKHRVSVANVACRWVLDQLAVAGVIVGARLTESEHIVDNLRVFELVLDGDDRQSLERASSAWRALPGDCGDEYRRPPFLTASGKSDPRSSDQD